MGQSPALPAPGWTSARTLGFSLLLPLGTALAGASIAPTITSPSAAAPALGNIEVRVQVDADEPIAAVELLVDGLPWGTLTEPPYVFEVALGEKNLSHRFEAVAVGVSDKRVSTSIVTPAIQVDDVVDLSLRQVYVAVTDRRGQRVLNLSQEDFRIFDEDRLQQIVTFAGGDIPFSAILLIDGSESMHGRKTAAARAGAKVFLTGMNDLDEAKVIVFSTRLLAASDFTDRRTPLNRVVEEVTPGGGSAINDFVFLGLQRLEERQGRRVLVLLSDGRDVHSVLRMQQVVGVARRSQAQVYWLRLQETRRIVGDYVDSWRDVVESRQQLRLLERVIKESGGRVLTVGAASEIPAAFEAVLRELREQYAIGYYPDRHFADGRWRRLRVEVRGRYQVESREGYLEQP